jgi:two-component system, OmpR family, sensor histidine kinase TctE
MRSLRLQLLVRLLVPLLALWALNAWLTYGTSLEAAHRAHDRTLMASVLAIAERISVVEGNVVVDLPYASLEMLESNLQSRVYYRVSQGNQVHLTGYERLNGPAVPLEPGRPHFYDSEFLGEPVRVAAMSKRLYDEPMVKEPVLILVAETGELRYDMSTDFVFEVAWKELVLIAIAAALTWWAVTHGLRPLYLLRNQVGRRSRSDLSRIELDMVPAELQPLIQAINEHTGQVARLVQSQKQFVADAAHQLKTPLAVLRSQADFAARQTDPAALNEVLDDIRATTARISRLVNQLLALARAEAVTAPLQPLELADWAREITFEYLPHALAKKVDLGFEGEGSLPIVGNKVLLHELLANLLDNALNYTPEGGRITVRLGEEGGERVSLAVEDTGLGIPADERERVLDRFYQIPGRASPGCGLGLAICREIAQLHGGTLAVAAGADGNGTVVRAVFPRMP